jgi:hypothetical protein
MTNASLQNTVRVGGGMIVSPWNNRDERYPGGKNCVRICIISLYFSIVGSLAFNCWIMHSAVFQ